MKKKIIKLFFCVLFSLKGFAQPEMTKIININFERTIDNRPNSNSIHKSYYNLKLFGNQKSFCDKILSDNAGKVNNSDSQTIEWKPSGENLYVIYKDYDKNEMFVKDHINFKFFVIKDSINNFNWEIKQEKKDILGFSCQLATSNFRGRNYEAWFTAELPVGGPWKFDDLPGMILSVKSVDNYLSWEAVMIKTQNEAIDLKKIENPFKNDSYLSWNEFKKKYKEKAIASSKYKSADGQDVGAVTPRMITERYIEENDNEYRADKEFEKLMNEKKN